MGEIKIFKTQDSKQIRDYFKKYELETLNLAGIIDNVPEAEIFTDSLDNPSGVLIRYKYFNYLHTKSTKFLDEMFEELFPKGKYGFAGTTRFLTSEIKRRYKLDWENDCDFYYMPKENYSNVALKSNASAIDIKDAEFIDENYNYRNSHTIHEIKDAISNRPSSGIYIDGKLVCWVLIHEDDSLGFMYTMDEHRGKGFALDVSLDISKKIIDKGKIPFLQIVSSNPMSPGLARKTGFVKKGQADWFGIIIE